MQVNKNIYLVDDDKAVCHALSLALEDCGYRVWTYYSAEVFLEEVKATTEGILLLDQRLEGMTGLDLQAELTQRGVAIPVIFITGQLDDQIRAEAVKAGAIRCLFKPFSLDDLLESISESSSIA